MTSIIHNSLQDRIFETGLDRGVLYPTFGAGVAWNGLISVEESTDDADSDGLYYDGYKYETFHTTGEFVASIEAYTYPREFQQQLGYLTAQGRPTFGLSYRTLVGSALHGDDYAYKIHLVYNAMVSPSSSDNLSLGEEVEPNVFNWDISTKPVKIPGYKASSHFVIDSRLAYPWVIEALEKIIYGTETEDPRLPRVPELIELFESGSILRITDHGDGSWSAEGPDEAITMIDSTTFEIDWPSAVFVADDAYTIQSM